MLCQSKSTCVCGMHHATIPYIRFNINIHEVVCTCICNTTMTKMKGTFVIIKHPTYKLKSAVMKD